MKNIKKITMLWKFFFWPVLWLFIFIPAYFWPLYLNGLLKIVAVLAGLVFMTIALFLTSAGGRTLAKTGHQKPNETIWPDTFTDFGIFSCMRHPMHLGLAIFPVALALISSSVPAILSSGWGVSGALWFVLHIEEKDALNKYGTVYRAYMQKVLPFSLHPKCLLKSWKFWKI